MISTIALAAVLGSLDAPTAPPLLQNSPKPAAQDEKPEPKEKTQAEKDKEKYDKAIADHETQEGMFKVHTKGDKILFEIPTDLLQRDILLATEIAQTPSGAYNGTSAGDRVLRFEKRGEKIYIRLMDFTNIATAGEAIKTAVRNSNVNPIIYAMTITATSPEGSSVVDVSRMFMGGVAELNPGRAIGGAAADASRSFVEKVRAFPENIHIESTMTFRGGGGGGGSPFGGPPARSSNTATVAYSMVLLPKEPMRPRLWDSRVGYFSVRKNDYGMQDYHGVKSYRYINRYRLEKKDPDAEMSEPVEPIVYYVSREVPEEWVEYCIRGIEEWQPAFEAAGFKNAIIGKRAPTVEEDPDWSPEDARHSVIRWAPLPIANAMGPHVNDPRSGEIISAHVIMWHDVLKLGADWYFAQASAVDPRARRLPFPEDLMGRILQSVVAHEVGHTLGLPHNGKSSAMVPVDLLRTDWTKTNGTSPSIMDYARYNYVAQPGDDAGTMMQVGPYDKFSIKWGYAPMPWAATHWDEVQTLDAWASRQVHEPMLRFYDNFNSVDPTAQSEALGDDQMKASSYGIANLKRIMNYIEPASVRIGEDYSEMRRMHGAVTSQYRRYLGHVLGNVGGVIETDYRGGRGSDVYVPVSKATQTRAVKWLLDNTVNNPPAWIVPHRIMSKISPNSGATTLRGFQSQALGGLVQNSRLSRMADNAARNGSKALSPPEMMSMIRKAVWSDLKTASPKIGYQERETQRLYVNLLTGKVSTNSSEVNALMLNDLQMQMKAIQGAMPRVKDHQTRIHLQDLHRSIKMTLENPPAAAAAAPTLNFPFPFGTDEVDAANDHDGCGICEGIMQRARKSATQN